MPWLLGGGAQPGRRERVVLTNPGPNPVTVDLSVLGTRGPVPSPNGRGIVVAPYGRTVVLLDAIAGTVVLDEAGQAKPDVVERADGSYLIAGSTPLDELAEVLGIQLPQDAGFHTAAGLVLHELKALPQEGATFETMGWRFEVVDMDGNRVDKVLVAPIQDH